MNDTVTILIPQPEEITQRERDDALGAYLMMFAAWGVGLPFPFLNLVAAGIYYGINRKKSHFVAFHALQSLLSQIPVTIFNALILFQALHHWLGNNMVGTFFWPSLFFAIGLNILYLIASIVALSRAGKGNFFYFPIFGRWAFDVFYGPKAAARRAEKIQPNRPPKGYEE